MARFQAQTPHGQLVQELELLVRTAVFKSASALVGVLLQQAAEPQRRRSTSPNRENNAKAGKPSKCNASLAPSRWRGITITIPAKNRGIIRRMPRWVWKWATRPLWPG